MELGTSPVAYDRDEPGCRRKKCFFSAVLS